MVRLDRVDRRVLANRWRCERVGGRIMEQRGKGDREVYLCQIIDKEAHRYGEVLTISLQAV